MERRGCPRIKIFADGIFYLQNDEAPAFEFTGVVEDISESGLKVVLDNVDVNEVLPIFSSDSQISFQIIDEFELLGEIKDEVIRGSASVIRICSFPNKISLGCKFTQINKELLEYVTNRQTLSYINVMNSQKRLSEV